MKGIPCGFYVFLLLMLLRQQLLYQCRDKATFRKAGKAFCGDTHYLAHV